MGKFLTAKDVAEKLNCHPQTVYRNKNLPVAHLPGIGLRYPEAELDDYLASFSNRLETSRSPLCRDTPESLTCPPSMMIIRDGGASEMAKAKLKSRYNLGFGRIYQRKTKDGQIRWYLDYRDEARKRVQKVAMNAQTVDEAALALRTEVSKAFNRAQGVKELKQISFIDFASLYLENYAKPNKKSWICDDYCLEAHLKPYFGKLDLREITPLEIEAYRAKRLKAGVRKSTTNRELALLKKMFHLAVDWSYCSDNPIVKVKLFPEKDNLKERVLSPEEEGKLISHCPPHLIPIVVFALNTGMRRGEILGLRWDQVDHAGKAIRVTGTKSGRDRIIPLNEAASEVIGLQRQKSNGIYVFPSTKGKEYMKSVAHSFTRACRKAGIMGLRFHDLRHTFASRLIQKGADIITVQNLLGHYSVTVTQRYTHTGADEKRRAVEILTRKPETPLPSCDRHVTEKSCVRATGSSTVN